MRKSWRMTTLAAALLLVGFSAQAEINLPGDNKQSNEDLAQYLKVLGEYLGYDLNAYCPNTGGPCQRQNQGDSFSNFLVNSASASGNEVNLMVSVLGALLPSNVSNGGQSSFKVVPDSGALSGYANLISQFGNKTFPQYSRPSESGATVSQLIDQRPYQNDPVSQMVLNILSTPDASYCINPDKGYFSPCYTGENNTSRNGGGPVLSQNQVLKNVMGETPPAPGYFPLGETNAQFIPQLSSDSLLGPMLFSTQSQTQNTSNTSENSGLTANNQLQTAANFIRYVTGAVSPLSLADRTKYGNLYSTAINASGKVKPEDQAIAKGQLNRYLSDVRVYAAQASVAASNLYSMLSKRMPQNSAAGDNEKSSQQLNEFIMATWRLYAPQNASDQNPRQQWLTQINQASNATVQKEIAILLAEINYQLYLSRQQQERLLMTNTMLLLQNAKNLKPTLETEPQEDVSTPVGDQ